MVPYQDGSLSSSVEWLLYQANGVSTIEDIVRNSPLDENQTLRSILALVAAGVLERGEQDPQAVSLTPPDGTRVLAGFAPGSEPSGPIPLLPLLSGSGAIPEHLGRYEVQEIIGRGAMGAVVLARDPAIDRIVAIKLIQTAIHLSAAELEKYRERFHREAKAAGKLLHPGIVTVFDVGQGQGEIPFIVMEYVRGKTLQEVLKTEELSPGEALRIAGDVLDALSYAHSQGVVHRDIKPSNILITPDRRAKIMDFGIAHVVGSEYTQAGEVLGSPNYMAPEQLSKKKIDQRTDLFAFGVVLYRMLTGKLPFTGDSFASIAGGVLSENPAPPETISPAVSPALGRVVLRCLEKDPARRFPSANQVKAALDSPESSSAMEALSPTDRSEPASAGAAAEPTPAASADASKNDLTPARRAAARGRARLALAISVPLLLTAAVLALFFAPGRPAEEASPPLASPPPPSDTGAHASGYPPQETAGPPALADGGDPDAASAAAPPEAGTDPSQTVEPEPEPTEAVLYHEAHLALEKGELEKSKERLEEILRRDPKFAGAPELLAKVNELLKAREPAQSGLRAALDDAQLFQEARATRDRGEWERSKATLEELLRRSPAFPGAAELHAEVSDGLWRKNLPMVLRGKHSHRIGGCDGTLTLTVEGIRYSSKEHEWDWKFEEVRVMERADLRSLYLETYEKGVLNLGKPKGYRFSLQHGLSDEAWTRLQRLAQKR
jgi:serine/threonine-protein kinase